MNRKECLDAAAVCVLKDRNNAYGGPEDNFADIAALRAVVAKCKHPLAKVALDEICVKMARLIHNPTHEDSWTDIAGYAACGAEVTAEKDKRTPQDIFNEMAGLNRPPIQASLAAQNRC